eukprot:TRINITY_DN20698_c0_g1_i1.p1 TRINITY_DN20698_c0_g1~~TRINITY_DN20698_c0_g1_i1.p1  ORF type:complete len:296 (-),score=38.12 TRINITY_DN20698_c0_g1_i1:264-1151(-)
MSVAVECFHHQATGTCTYVVASGSECCIVDPVIDFGPGNGVLKDAPCKLVVDFITKNNFVVKYIIETHVHADHLTGAEGVRNLLSKLPNAAQHEAKVVIGKGVTLVQQTFKEKFNLEYLTCDGSQFDVLVGEGDNLQLGEAKIIPRATPGHTPDSCTYQIGDAVFVGDTIFMPDSGTARCDFPNGSADQLYQSIQKIYSLPDDTRVFVCHDYGASGSRDYKWETTIGKQKADNISCSAATTKADYIEKRTTRDAQLAVPALIYPSVQFNLMAGKLPPPDKKTGLSTIAIPLTAPY